METVTLKPVEKTDETTVIDIVSTEDTTVTTFEEEMSEEWRRKANKKRPRRPEHEKPIPETQKIIDELVETVEVVSDEEITEEDTVITTKTKKGPKDRQFEEEDQEVDVDVPEEKELLPKEETPEEWRRKKDKKKKSKRPQEDRHVTDTIKETSEITESVVEITSDQEIIEETTVVTETRTPKDKPFEEELQEVDVDMPEDKELIPEDKPGDWRKKKDKKKKPKRPKDETPAPKANKEIEKATDTVVEELSDREEITEETTVVTVTKKKPNDKPFEQEIQEVDVEIPNLDEIEEEITDGWRRKKGKKKSKRPKVEEERSQEEETTVITAKVNETEIEAHSEEEEEQVTDETTLVTKIKTRRPEETPFEEEVREVDVQQPEEQELAPEDEAPEEWRRKKEKKKKKPKRPEPGKITDEVAKDIVPMKADQVR